MCSTLTRKPTTEYWVGNVVADWQNFITGSRRYSYNKSQKNEENFGILSPKNRVTRFLKTILRPKWNTSSSSFELSFLFPLLSLPPSSSVVFFWGFWISFLDFSRFRLWRSFVSFLFKSFFKNTRGPTKTTLWAYILCSLSILNLMWIHHLIVHSFFEKSHRGWAQ